MLPGSVHATVPTPVTLAPLLGNDGPTVAAFAGLAGSAASASMTIKTADKILESHWFFMFDLLSCHYG
jgi:hypothetical protein